MTLGFGRVVYRCFNCKRFVSNRWALCRSCLYDHGMGVHSHEAEPIT